MKILMVLDHEFPPDTRVQNEIEALIENNHEVHIACYTRQNRKKLDYFGNAVIHRKKISSFLYRSSVGALTFPFYFNFWRKFLTSLFQECQYDAIHIHDLPLAKVGKEMAIKFDAKFILDLHENWSGLLNISQHTKTIPGRLLSNLKQWRSYEIVSCQSADKIIVVVDEAKKRLVKSGIEEDKISVVSNTLNLKHFIKPTGVPDNNYITAVYAGGINKHRGLQHVILGMNYLKGLPKPFRLWIIGSGSYSKYLKELAVKAGVIKQIEFLGWKSLDELSNYYGKADFFLIPHEKNEHTDSTIPHKLFQYMYAQKPIIASNCKPIERIIKETKAGLIYQYNDPKEYSEKVQTLVNNFSKNDSLDLERAHTAVLNEYNWALDKEILKDIYSQQNLNTLNFMDNPRIYENFNWETLGLDILGLKVKKILESIPTDVETIIDIGCGNGVISNVLGKAYKVTAVDRSEKALGFVKTDKVLASADNIPLPNASFDMVFSSEMLEHLPDGVFEKSLAEMKRLAKKYIFITVPNDENPDKLAIRCPSCGFVYNSPNHLRSFKVTDFEKLFPEFNLINSLTFGKKVRYYNKTLLGLKKRISPAHSWIPYYWMPKEKRETICPKCEHVFENPYRFNLLATAADVANLLLSPKKPYWLFVLMEKK